MVTCAGTGKAPTCVLHHAKPWDYNKRALSSVHTCFVAPHHAGRQPAQNAAKPADIHRSREGNTMATRFSFTAATWRAHRQQCTLLCLVAALCLALPAQASPHRSDTSAAQGAKRKKRRTAGPCSNPAQQLRGIARATRQAAVPRMPGQAQRRGMRRIYPAATRQTAALSVPPTKNSPTPESDSGKVGNTLSPLDFLTHRHAG